MLAYIFQQSRRLLTAAAVASTIHGFCNVLILAQINKALTAPPGSLTLASAIQFGACALVALLSQIIASILSEHANQNVHTSLRRFIAHRVLSADYRHLEETGAPRVQAALTEHCSNLTEFLVGIPNIIVNIVTVLGCLAYLAWLSWQIFLVATLTIILGCLGYQVVGNRASRHLEAAAQEQDRMFDHFRALVDGAKELRLNAGKRRRFRDEVLDDSLQTYRREQLRGTSLYLVSSAWGGLLLYIFIGLVLYVLVGNVPDRAQVTTGFALVILYMVPPLGELLQELPRASQARVSHHHIQQITEQLQQHETDAHADAHAAPLLPPSSPGRIRLEGVCYRYYHEGKDEVFTLGPINLDLVPGQIIFLVGGNGSGKTSLAKLLVGLYKPAQGTILLDGQPVNDHNRDAYRQHFSTIFADFHLFGQLLDQTSAAQDDKGNALLQKLQLHHKVQVRRGAFTTRALSQGQRKRLALTITYLEDRPFLVFDEWAADQDPVFKDVFYRQLLPGLRSQGKTVLVISHDDRYFDEADQIIRMENGQIIGTEDHCH